MRNQYGLPIVAPEYVLSRRAVRIRSVALGLAVSVIAGLGILLIASVFR